MNLYLCYTDNGNVYVVKANFSFEAVRKVEQQTGEKVTSWDISVGYPPPAAKWLL